MDPQTQQQMNPDDAMAALALATHFSEQMTGQTAQLNQETPSAIPSGRPSEESAATDSAPGADPEAEIADLENRFSKEIKDLRKEVRDTIKKEIGAIKDEIKSALDEQD